MKNCHNINTSYILIKAGLVLLFILFGISEIYGQELRIQGGRNISYYDYRNSDNERLEDLQEGSNIVFALQYRTVNPMSRFHYSAGIAYNRYTASGSDSELGNYFDWQADYLALDLSADFEILQHQFYYGINEKELTILIRAIISPELLVRGTQTLNNEVISLVGTEQFERPFVFARGGLSVNYKINKHIGIYAEYTGGKSLITIGKPDDPEESLHFIAHSLYFGLSVQLPY